MSRVATIVLGSFVILFCSSAVAQEQPDYFPLQVGNWWEYLMVPDSALCRIVVRDTEEHNGKTYHELVPVGTWVLPDSMLYRKEGPRVYRYYEKRDREYLSEDFSLRQTAILPADPDSIVFIQLWAIDETVTVPAGTFHGCVTFIDLSGDPMLCPSFERTFAPGVGIVRLDVFMIATWPILYLARARVGGVLIPTGGVGDASWGEIKRATPVPQPRW